MKRHDDCDCPKVARCLNHPCRASICPIETHCADCAAEIGAAADALTESA